MPTMEMKRRDFVKLGIAAGGAIAAMSMLPKKVFSYLAPSVTLDECLAMTPVEMAEKSYLIQDAWKDLRAVVKGIGNPVVRIVAENILENPAPTFMERYPTPEARAALRKELIQAGLLDEKLVPEGADFPPALQDPQKAPQPFYSAPGSGYQSHHSYPGGNVTHTGLNVKMALALSKGYEEVYGYTVDKTVVVAAETLHDLHKAWVFQWLEDGSCRKELSLAGTGEHHTYGIAESMYRGLPPEIVVAQACEHGHPGTEKDEQGPVNWIKAAAILAGKDPVKEGYLAQSGATLPVPRDQEYFICHLADGDWVLMVPVAKWMISVMEKIAVKEYGLSEADSKTKKFNAFRNYVFSQASIEKLYQIYNAQGEDALIKLTKSIVTV